MSTMRLTLSDLPNLGSKVVSQLRDSGITSVRQLAQIGPANAYRRLRERAGRRLPRCYYLYSLEGALRGIPWSALSADEKRQLSLAADAETRPSQRRRRST